MAQALKTTMAKVKNNPIGAIAGAGLTYYGLKKSGKVTKMWMLISLTAVGAVVGAIAQSKMGAMSSTSKFLG
tara:strand:+ start:463 stop:678 length:216 start_codon:yes stop_codon:yes gene_type:complete